MKAYSTDLRERIVLAYEGGEGTLDEVADLFEVGRRTVARFLQKYRAGGSLAPQPHGGGYPAVLQAKHLTLLREQVLQAPDATLAELASYLKLKAGVGAHPATVCRALQRPGLPRKKKSGGDRAGGGRPPSLPPAGGTVGARTLYFYRRDRLSPGHDEGLRACATRGARHPARAAQARHQRLVDREPGAARGGLDAGAERGRGYALLRRLRLLLAGPATAPG
jgi:transposase